MFAEELILESWQLAVKLVRPRPGRSRHTVICERSMTACHDGAVRCVQVARACQNGNDPGRPAVGTDDDLGGLTCLIAYCVVRGWVGSASRMTVVSSSRRGR